MNFMTQVVEFSTDQATTPDKVRDSSPTNVFIVTITNQQTYTLLTAVLPARWMKVSTTRATS